jgi:glycylpeptide N-tetradecanoyltransferase
MKDSLILAKHTYNAEVYNALNIMDNNPETILKECKFGIGDGILHYYLYNWKMALNNYIQPGGGGMHGRGEGNSNLNNQEHNQYPIPPDQLGIDLL